MADSYPQHEKLKAVEHDHALISSFVEWLEGRKDVGIAEWYENRYWHLSGGQRKIEELIAEFFEIDRAEFLREKEEMYQELRAAAKTKGGQS